MALFPDIDAQQQDCITYEQAQFFRDNGLLLMRNVLVGDELAAVREQTMRLVDQAVAGTDCPDTKYRNHELTGERVPFRVEYVIEKTTAGKSLLGHPFILRTVEKLQGRNFIPTWDSMVFKNQGSGAAIMWHRDGGANCVVSDKPIFNVDFYLDQADLSNCLWGLPGSNLWAWDQAEAEIKQRNTGGFNSDGAVPILMQPGDVLFHNILVLHGSPPTQNAPLRRVLYYEFRPGEVERELGPHRPEYIPVKQKVLLACLRDRAMSPYSHGETPFEYRPGEAFSPPEFALGEALRTYRYPHEDWWRGKR